MRLIYFFVSSSLLIGLLLLIRKLFRKKLAPGVIYALWLIPLTRLLVPFAGWELPVFGTVADVLNTSYAIVTEWMEDENSPENTETPALSNQGPQKNAVIEGTKIYDAVNQEKSETADVFKNSITPVPEKKETSEKHSYVWVVFGVWLVGSFLLGTYVLVHNRKLKRIVNTMEVVAESQGVKVCLSDETKVPCLVGLKNPKIIISKDVFNNPDLYQYVLQHELTHFHQKDHIWTAVRILMCVIYWWNPFVWLGAVCVEEDAELACDARVLKGQTSEVRRAYGYALLQMLENAGNKNQHFYVATSMSGDQKSMKQRIQEISLGTSTKKYVLLPITVLLAAVFVLGCGMPSDQSWIKTGEWINEEAEDIFYYESEYEYSLQENIKSQLIYCEIYQFGELAERKILACGEIENSRNTILLRHEISKNSDDRRLVLEANGIGTEMQNPLYRYSGGGAKSFGSLQSEEPIEIIPEKSLILGAEYHAIGSEVMDSLSAVYSSEEHSYEGSSIQTYDCTVLSDYTEEEIKALFKDDFEAGVYVIGLYRIVFSELSATELYNQYEQSEFNGVVGKLFGEYTDCEEFTTAWAEAFVRKDVGAIAGMVNGEAYMQLKAAGLMGEEEAYRYFGWSSPWPMWKEQRYKILSCDDFGAEILYYADSSFPHVYVWQENLQFERRAEVCVHEEAAKADSECPLCKDEGSFLVKNEQLRIFEQIQSIGEFYQAYPEGKISGTMMDYAFNGLGEILNQNALEQPKDEYYEPLFEAGTAAVELLNLSKDKELVDYSVEDTGGSATVQIRFLNEDGAGDAVEVTMWQPYGEDGIWIPK